jgi:hypothetical protein
MVKDLKENPEAQQINRVEKVEINVGSNLNLGLVLGVLVGIGILLAKVNDLERKLNLLKLNLK